MISEIDIRDWESVVECAKEVLTPDSPDYLWDLVNKTEQFIDQQKRLTAALLRKKEN